MGRLTTGCGRLALRCAFNNRYALPTVSSILTDLAQTGKGQNPVVRLLQREIIAALAAPPVPPAP